MAAPKKKDKVIEILPLKNSRLRFCILGKMPILLNRVSEKAQRELLCPGGPKDKAKRAVVLKHKPYAEYRAAPYRDSDPKGPTALQFLAAAFKGAMMEAALDIPDVNKSQIKRLLWVDAERVSLYGVPELHMTGVRSSDMNRTPDMRTRAIIRDWACEISVSFRDGILRPQGIVNLLAAAGTTPGVGDWRIGKGGVMGQFEIVDDDDPRFVEILANGGREAQLEALRNPAMCDLETADLLEWYKAEVARRGFDVEELCGTGNGVSAEVRA